MFSVFRSKPPLDAEEWEWQLAAFSWLEREFGAGGPAGNRILARPDGPEFPELNLTGHALAGGLLDQVKSIAGIGDWPTTIQPFHASNAGLTLSHGVALAGGDDAGGTFRLMRTDQGQPFAEIRYSERDLAKPSVLVGTLAHEMAHYLLHTASGFGPGGEECEELLTDLTAVWLGFGIFLGNSARYGEHVADDHGYWYKSGHRGYLSERALMSAMAVSETLAGRDPMIAAPYFKAYLVDDLKRATKFINRRDIRSDMSAIELADYGI